jgi:hypothetical protein
VCSAFERDATAYDGLGANEEKRIAEMRALCHSPLDTLFYFMPKSLWVLICAETNRYNLQQINRCAVAMQAKQVASRHETVPQICRRLKAKPAYENHEILHVIGLLVARMLCSQKCGFAAHWSVVDDGAVPAGNFGQFMECNRCQDIHRDLHVTDNEAPHMRDKLWKLRPVVEKLQQCSWRGGHCPPSSRSTKASSYPRQPVETRRGCSCRTVRVQNVYDVRLVDRVLPSVSCFSGFEMSSLPTLTDATDSNVACD